MPSEQAVEVDKVSKFFRRGRERIAAIDDLTVAIPDGRITGLVGPDGAGKTTLLRLMAGLLVPDLGRVTVLGHDSLREISAVRLQIGYMPQRFGLYEDLSVAENLRLFGDLHLLAPAELAARQAELLEFTGLADFTERLAGKLSGGMKQKLGLACALLARPQLLLLDEPSVGVDPISRRELWRLVQILAGTGTAVVWSTAYLDEAEKCDEIVVLEAGRILANGRPGDLIAGARMQAFLLPVNAEQRRAKQREMLQNPAIRDATLLGSELRVVVADGDERAVGEDVSPGTPRLEDAVISLLRRQEDRHGSLVLSPAAPPERTGQNTKQIIAVDQLSRRFGSFVAVDRVSFSVRRGEVFGLLGPNGAGKSTIFRTLCGLLPPSSGTATVAGIDLGRASAEARQRIGYMAQRFSLYGDLTARENLRFMAGAYGLSRRRFGQRLDWACDAFDLHGSLDAICNTLSLGHKQRLSLAAAVLHEPEVLFLDEPTSGVDPLARRDFWLRIGLFVESGMTVLVTSHFMDEAENCDRIAIIDRGHLLVLDTPAALRARCATSDNPAPSLDDAFVHVVQQVTPEAAP